MRPILHLNLKRKWFDMIESGEKKEEYRDDTNYWNKRFFVINNQGLIAIKYKYYLPEEVVICFSNGYAKKRDQFLIKCTRLRKGIGRKEWGASGGQQFILSLGEELK